jgi:putative phosphoesterase
MRIGILSDIHSNGDALSAILGDLHRCDKIFFLGDLVGYGAQPNQVVEDVRKLKPQIALMGNHDHAVITGDTTDFVRYAARAIEWTRKQIQSDNLTYLSNLQVKASMHLNGMRLAMYHGSPRDPLNEYIFPGLPLFIVRNLIELATADVLLLGHTHIPFIARDSNRILANPGSVGQPRDGDPRASYGILEVNDGKVEFTLKRVKYDIDSAASRIIKAGLPSFLAERLYLGL